jgi:hypothetical protein
VPESDKRAARAARWRSTFVTPDFQTMASRRRFREAVAEARIEGDIIPPVAAVALKAAADHVDDAYRQRELSPSEGKLVITIERFGSPMAALRASNTPDADAPARHPYRRPPRR